MAEGPNSALIRESIDAFNRHDVEAVLASVTEDVEWQRVDGLPDGGGVIRGREAVRALMEPNAFERMTAEPREIVESGDVALVALRVTALGAASGVELEVDAFVVYRFENGLARRVENYTVREDAERAAGLRLG
jgi:ketosteroid isomerase-like protein